ncbi:MAG: metal ABC transporter substrate-binding protein [Candidatus Margulisiibacteriota bacterium]|nr:metal ABC transporter substrate-binding protein [Candidatus Margulisiibacteriota bacterium]
MKQLVLKILVVCLFFSAGCAKAPPERVRIVVTTSLIGSIVKEVGKDRIDVVAIVPSGMCPGHFDVKPGDIAAASDAKLLLSHGWEGWMSKLLSAVENERLLTKTVNVKGNWMIPDLQIQATRKITGILCALDEDNCKGYRENSSKYITSIKFAESRIKRFKNVKALVSKMQAPFIKWLGIKVAAAYGRPEDLTPSEMIKLINIGKNEKVELVVDNLQSGPVAGKQIAQEIGVKQVMLTNFPQGSYILSLNQNVEKIIKALR